MYLSDVIKEGTVDAVCELFQSYDTYVTFADAAESKQENIQGFLGMIGFSGKKMKGNISIWMSGELIRKTGHEGINKTDWIGEMANQLIGRVKNKLLPYGVEIMLGTPTSIETGSLVLNFIQASVQKYRFVYDEQQAVTVFMDAVFEKDTTVEKQEDTNDAIKEGEMMLF